jgi:hypothetical protein
MKKFVALVIIGCICGGMSLVYAQRVVESNDLKVSPAKYKNSSITLKDVFTKPGAGISPALTASGYTSKKYISFVAGETGMPCFMRRSSTNEKLVAGLKEGEQITIVGTVKQPEAEVERAEGRITDKYDLDIYVIEVRQITKGWEGEKEVN